MIVTASSVIVEFNEIVLDPDDWQIIGHLPFPLRTYAAARVTNLMAYVLLTIASVSFFPMIIGVGLRDSGWWVPAALRCSFADRESDRRRRSDPGLQRHPGGPSVKSSA